MIELALPMPPNNANPGSRTHWATKGRDKKKYFRDLDERQNCGLIPAPPVRPYDHALVSAWMGLGRRMDDDNAKFRAYKWPCDWLKTRGYLVDDKRPHCQMEDPVQMIVPRDERLLLITITPIE